MEEIVKYSPELSWEGWDVVRHTKSNGAAYSADGAFVNGHWHKKKVFPITEQGWHVPESIGNRYARMER